MFKMHIRVDFILLSASKKGSRTRINLHTPLHSRAVSGDWHFCVRNMISVNMMKR